MIDMQSVSSHIQACTRTADVDQRLVVTRHLQVIDTDAVGLQRKRWRDLR
jgi:hypothetical protein